MDTRCCGQAKGVRPGPSLCEPELTAGLCTVQPSEPARAVKSQIAPSTRDADSDTYRVQENANLQLNIKQDGLFGKGFGVKIDYALPITDISQTDLNNALETAGIIGDDYIQTQLAGQRVDPSQFSHGTSAQRQKWFTTGWQTGQPNSCNTFDTDNLG